MLDLIEQLEEQSYLASVYRSVLEEINPPGWRERSQQSWTNWQARSEHHKQFESAIAEVEQKGDSDIVLNILRLLLADKP